MSDTSQARPACAPHAPSWFGRGRWAECACGFAPRDNSALNEHWREAGFRVVDDHGHLVTKQVGDPCGTRGPIPLSRPSTSTARSLEHGQAVG